MGNVVIVSKRPSPVVLPLDDNGQGRITLVPGENDVDRRDWETACARQGNKRVIEGGEYPVYEKKGAKKAVPLSENLSAVTPAAKAIEYVGKCENLRMLQVWGRNETRVTVQRAIAEQMAKIQSGAERKQEDEETVSEE